MFEPVATKEDFDTLDLEEVIQGYRDFRSGEPEPGENRGRSYWHGWMNNARDHGERPMTSAARNLALELVHALEPHMARIRRSLKPAHTDMPDK